MKKGLLSASPLVFLTLCAAYADFSYPGDQVGGKSPNSFAFAAARVRLLTPSLP